jgi:photosystem II stability/assembly factor-like uncharacterized protein
MNIVQRVVGQVESIINKATDTDFAPVEQIMHKPLIIAGTSKGLLFLGSKQYVELEGFSITALASKDSQLWAITDYNLVWHRDQKGEWRKVASMNDLQLTCILPTQDAVLVGTSGACLIRIADGSTHRINCFEKVEGRSEWYTPWGAPPDVRSMAIGSEGELYVNVHVGGILRSLDQGQSWQPTIDFDSDVHEVKTINNYPDIVLAATAYGLAISKDKGNSWSFDRTNLHDDYSRAIAVCSETILMTASTGPDSHKAAIYRRPLNEPGKFEKCSQGLPEWFPDNINTGTVASLGNVAAFGTRDGEIFLSNDAGLTWKQIATDLAAINCLNLYPVDI